MLAASDRRMLSPTLITILGEWFSLYTHGALFGASRVAKVGSRRSLNLIFWAMVERNGRGEMRIRRSRNEGRFQNQDYRQEAKLRCKMQLCFWELRVEDFCEDSVIFEEGTVPVQGKCDFQRAKS